MKIVTHVFADFVTALLYFLRMHEFVLAVGEIIRETLFQNSHMT